MTIMITNAFAVASNIALTNVATMTAIVAVILPIATGTIINNCYHYGNDNISGKSNNRTDCNNSSNSNALLQYGSFRKYGP